MRLPVSCDAVIQSRANGEIAGYGQSGSGNFFSGSGELCSAEAVLAFASGRAGALEIHVFRMLSVTLSYIVVEMATDRAALGSFFPGTGELCTAAAVLPCLVAAARRGRRGGGSLRPTGVAGVRRREVAVAEVPQRGDCGAAAVAGVGASRRNQLLPRSCSRWSPRTEASGRRNCWHSARSFRRARSPLSRCATPRRTRRVIGFHLNSGQGCLQSCGRPCPSSESGSDAVVAARTAEARVWRRVRAPHHLGGTKGVAATKMPHLRRRRDRGLGRVERSCGRVRQRFLWRPGCFVCPCVITTVR